MVCNRCIIVVKQEFEKLNLTPIKVQLGEVELEERPSDSKMNNLTRQLEDIGFELLDDRKMMMVEKVKNIIIEAIHRKEEIDIKVNFSNLIQQQLHIEYNYISALFSNTEGITIEQYIILQRIERAKEMLVYNELTLSEISYKLAYSSVQHLSTQFKKVTGLTPSHFKMIKENKRKALDEL